MLKNSFYIIIITIALTFSVELVMYGIYLVTGSKYVSNLSEDRSRALHYEGKVLDCHIDSKKDVKKPIRIAIFGGSSSVGFASPVSFTDLLCDSGFNNNHDMEITNYAGHGEPLAGFQAEIIKSVMNYYDVIIIYSGHNEKNNQIYLRESRTVFPNGIPFEQPRSVHKTRVQKLNKIKYRLNPKHSISYPMIVENSRVHYFLARIIDKLTRYMGVKLKPSKKETIYPKDFYYSDYFISPAERKSIINLYKKNIIEISNKLRKDQKLILSTVLSNDLFPPLADVYPVSHGNEIDVLNDQLIQTYFFLSNNEYEKVRESVSMLPKSAHRYYLEGILCLRTDLGSANPMPKDCISKLKKARDLDGLPSRVPSEINSFIRQFRHDNVVVVDPVTSMLNKVSNSDDYREYFVDFQHPSNLGHALIAENILFGLFGSDVTSRSYDISACGINWKHKSKLKSFNVSLKKCVTYLKINMKWLDTFMKIQPIPYQYDYYKSAAERALMMLEKKTIS